jgi:uncharacterized protein (DUF885 family)
MDHDLDRLGEEYFHARCAADPFGATIVGVAGFDAEVPDPSRAAAASLRARLGAISAELERVDPGGLTGTDRVSHAMLTRLLRDEQDALRAGLDEVAVTATMTGALPQVVSTVPAASVADPPAAQAYLTRLGRIGGYFDGWRQRHLQAKADGRYPTAIGVRQAIAQLDAYLATPLDRDPLLRPVPGPDVDERGWRARAAELLGSGVRPALARYRTALADELLPVARPDERVGACFVPGGEAGYLDRVRAHTTSELAPDEIHRTGLDLVAALREEFAERGARTLGTSDVDEVLRRLRTDPALRFESRPRPSPAVRRRAGTERPAAVPPLRVPDRAQ